MLGRKVISCGGLILGSCIPKIVRLEVGNMNPAKYVLSMEVERFG